MIVFIRLFWALVRSRFRRKLGVLDEFDLTMRVWPNDLDLNVHMNSGRYISLIDIARVEMIGRTRLLRKMFRRRWRPIAAQTTIRYRRSLLPFQRFTIRSRVVCWDDKWIYFRHVMERRGELCAVAYVRGLFRGPDGNVKPQQILDLAGSPGLQSPPMPDDLAKWVALELA